MSPARVGLLICFLYSTGAVADEPEAPGAGPTDPVVGASAGATWSTRLDAYLYLQEEDDFLLPILAADRGALHLEGRYQYEDFQTFSAWVGWSLEVGESLQLAVVPMAGVIVGRTDGVAPGLEVTLSWRNLELYSESEYVFNFEDVEGDYLYTWSELSWQATAWLKLGLAAQRTRLYRSELDVERGLFVGVSRGRVELTVYGWNLDGEAPYAVVALGLDF